MYPLRWGPMATSKSYGFEVKLTRVIPWRADGSALDQLEANRNVNFDGDWFSLFVGRSKSLGVIGLNG